MARAQRYIGIARNGATHIVDDDSELAAILEADKQLRVDGGLYRLIPLPIAPVWPATPRREDHDGRASDMT